METDFKYDVFLSHSSKNKDVVREIANRLKSDGVHVWFDEWEIRPGDSIPAKIEDGLEYSRVLVFCMSNAAFAADWPQLESHTFRFKDPLNHNRRFIPLKLDDTPIKGSLAQFSYINWQQDYRKQEYSKLLDACSILSKEASQSLTIHASDVKTIQLNFDKIPSNDRHQIAVSRDSKFVVTAGYGIPDAQVRFWELESGQCLYVSKLPLFGSKGFVNGFWSLAISLDGSRVISGDSDGNIQVWDTETMKCKFSFKGNKEPIEGLGWSFDGQSAISGAYDGTVKLWDIDSGKCLKVLKGHTKTVACVALGKDNRYGLSGSGDKTIRLWDLTSGRCIHEFKGHTAFINCVVLSDDCNYIISGAFDNTIRLWDANSGRSIRIFEGHTDNIISLSWFANRNLLLSGSADRTVRLWDVDMGLCLHVFEGHKGSVKAIEWSLDGKRAISVDESGGIRIWDLSEFISGQDQESQEKLQTSLLNQIQYTNAKVLLVGNSAAGKTGISNRLALDIYKETDSTVGAWATQWNLPIMRKNRVEREVWLWDFGGQADQRLIHQLYMDQTQLAVLVFDPQKKELLEELGTWDHDLSRAAAGDFCKLLVAGRIDAGGLRSVSRQQVEEFAREHNFAKYIETSAKENIGCKELKEAICKLIDWDSIAKRTTPKLFRRLKEEIVALKDENRILIRFNELRDALSLRMSGDHFTDEELKAVVSLLAGPGVVWELGFGSWVLLAPEMINSYAQAVIRTIQEDDRELGCITEECVLAGKLSFPKELQRLPEEEERILLLAMHQLLVENNLCLNEPTDNGTLLVFPSYARRERPDLIEHPSVLVSYQFEGFLDDIYATLVVRLHRISPFTTQNLWNGAADFETLTGQKLGVKLSRKAAGKAELLVYFDPDIPIGERMIFSKYIQEHLFRMALDLNQVKRLRHWICEECGEPVSNRERAMQRLNDDGSKAKIICVNCEEYVKLWDEMEAAFADPEIMRRVRELETEGNRELDNESKERALVGDVISTVGLAGQISREFSVSDHGIDMEIEFKNDAGEATGKKLYLQLKSGDSYLKRRKIDGAEIFRVSKLRHIKYWMNQSFPVMLVIRNSEGEIRWMEIRDHLKKVTNNGKKQVKQIVFESERFNVMSVRRWREKL